MRPPLDIPRAPPSSSTLSIAIPTFDDGASERGHLAAQITRGFARCRQRLAVRLLDVLSRDSATLTATPLSRGGRHLHGHLIRGAHGDASLTGLPRLLKAARSGNRKPPVNPAPLIVTNPLPTRHPRIIRAGYRVVSSWHSTRPI